MKINSIQELVATPGIPVGVIHDINNRITDWLASGGKITDPYIQPQYRYAERFINKEEEGSVL